MVVVVSQPTAAILKRSLRAVGGLNRDSALIFMRINMQVKQVYMLTNGYAVMPEGYESFLYSGFGYTLKEEEANYMIRNGLAVSMEAVDGTPKVKNRSRRGSGNNNRGKGLSKGGRKPRG